MHVIFVRLSHDLWSQDEEMFQLRKAHEQRLQRMKTLKESHKLLIQQLKTYETARLAEELCSLSLTLQASLVCFMLLLLLVVSDTVLKGRGHRQLAVADVISEED